MKPSSRYEKIFQERLTVTKPFQVDTTPSNAAITLTSQSSTTSSPSSTATLVTSLTISGTCVVVREAVARTGFLLEDVRITLYTFSSVSSTERSVRVLVYKPSRGEVRLRVHQLWLLWQKSGLLMIQLYYPFSTILRISTAPVDISYRFQQFQQRFCHC